MVKIAFIDPTESKLSDQLQSALPKDWTCTQSKSYDEAEQTEAAHDVDVIFAIGSPVTAKIMAAAPNLQLVQKLGVGVDNFDIDYCQEHGVGVARLAGVNAAPVAEHVLLLMLASLRQLPSSDRRIHGGEWFKEEGRGFQRELRGKTVGLVGLGYVGKSVARRLKGFEVEVLYYDLEKMSDEIERELEVTYIPLDELIPRVDILSLHVPLTTESARIIDERRIALMKPQSFLINCARGGLVDEHALLDAINAGRVAGAGLDTFENEPRFDRSILIDKVIGTPHTAGATADNFAFVVERALKNVDGYISSRSISEDDTIFLPPSS